MWAILAGLNSSTILRLKKTWDVSVSINRVECAIALCSRIARLLQALSAKYRLVMERLRGVIEHTKVSHMVYSWRNKSVLADEQNHAAYRARLREVNAPCLPFLGLILTE